MRSCTRTTSSASRGCSRRSSRARSPGLGVQAAPSRRLLAQVEAIGRRRRQEGEWVVVVNYRDVTDQRELQEQLLHSQKLEAVGRLAGGVAHDFNNLLTAIGGYSEFLSPSFDDDDPRRADRARDRARRPIAPPRSRASCSPSAAARCCCRRCSTWATSCAGLERLLSRLIGENVELSTAVAPGCLVRADRGQLEQVIMNLALNARDAMPDGGTVELRTCGRRDARSSCA